MNERVMKEDKILLAGYCLLLGGLLFSLRAVLSGAMILMVPAGFYYQYKSKSTFFNKKLVNGFFLAAVIFFVLQSLGLLFTTNQTETVKDLRGKLPLLAVPLICCSNEWMNPINRKKILNWFTLAAGVVSIYSLTAAVYRYSITGICTRFFYHEFSEPVRHNAVVLSILVFISFTWLIENVAVGNYLYSKQVCYSLLALLLVTLILLSSKLVLFFLCIYLLFFFSSGYFKRIKRNHSLIILPVFILLVAFINSPVRERFTEITAEKKVFLNEKDITPALYLNGLQFRLLEFKIVPRILTEQNAWWRGVSSGDAQALLDEKYLAFHLYHGDGTTANGGFLGYYTHNQFLESLLQSGIAGLLAFIFLCIGMILMAVKTGTLQNWIITALLLCYCFTESVLETQYTIFIFLFFPLFFYEPNINKE